MIGQHHRREGRGAEAGELDDAKPFERPRHQTSLAAATIRAHPCTVPRLVAILTGPVRSGKTTRLGAWAEARGRVGGLLSPDGPEGRRLADLASGSFVEMERPGEGEPSVDVGPFRFRQAAFTWGEEVLAGAATDPGIEVIVLDEVGPLELAGRGFADALDRLTRSEGAPLVIFVRDTLLAAVRARWGLYDAPSWDEAMFAPQ